MRRWELYVPHGEPGGAEETQACLPQQYTCWSGTGLIVERLSLSFYLTLSVYLPLYHTLSGNISFVLTLSVYLSFSLALSGNLSLMLSIYLSLSITLSRYISLFSSITLSVCISFFSPPFRFSLLLYLSLCFSLSLSPKLPLVSRTLLMRCCSPPPLLWTPGSASTTSTMRIWNVRAASSTSLNQGTR